MSEEKKLSKLIEKRNARIIGAFFLIAFVLHTIGSTIMEDLLSSSGYLSKLHANSTSVIIAEIIELIAALAILVIVIKTYPILKEYNEKMAGSYAILRTIEVIMLIVGVIISFSLLSLSQEYVSAGSSNSDYYNTRGTLLVSGRYWTFKVVLICVLFGYLMFFYTLHRMKLIPRFITVWGIIIVPLVLTGILLEIFVSDAFGNSTMFPGFLIFYLPGAPLDVVLGFWLLIKGFNEESILLDTTTSD